LWSSVSLFVAAGLPGRLSEHSQPTRSPADAIERARIWQGDPVTADTPPAATSPLRSLRFGLVGTGYWARVAHARALASTPGIEFAAVWGRDADATATLAASFGATGHSDFDAFLADVDAVAFSVPPDVQSVLAVRAARAGKHLLLEKPLALTAEASRELVAAVEAAAVASVVFFTSRFQAESRAWLAQVTATGGWTGGQAVWLGSVYAESSPFNTPWRREKGALWDLGPHVISLLWPILGPVETVTADVGRGDLTYLVLHHRGGATSSMTLTLGAPEAADGFDLQVWGERGRTSVPSLADDPTPALRVALTELADNARSGRTTHPCDVRFGDAVTQVLVHAQAQREGSGSHEAPDPSPSLL
jgi:predicted dehydrogenase